MNTEITIMALVTITTAIVMIVFSDWELLTAIAGQTTTITCIRIISVTALTGLMLVSTAQSIVIFTGIIFIIPIHSFLITTLAPTLIIPEVFFSTQKRHPCQQAGQERLHRVFIQTGIITPTTCTWTGT